MTMPGQGIRKFTRVEDELIVRQSQGGIDIKELRRALRANVTTLQRRAGELGVKLNFKTFSQPSQRKPKLSTYDDLMPARIRDDRLLKRLIEVHGEPPDA